MNPLQERNLRSIQITLCEVINLVAVQHQVRGEGILLMQDDVLRESGTEPVVRVMVEAPDHDTCQKYVDEVVNVICEKGYKA